MLRNVGLRKSVEQPVLDLNFAASQIGSNAAPDSRIDFSRGSNAWFVDSDGLVKKSPHNLLLRSEDLSTTWSKLRANVTTNATTSPIGTLTADKLYLDSTSSISHFAIQNVNIVAGQKSTFSVYLKASELTFAYVTLLNNSAPYQGITIAVNLSDGSTNLLNVANGATEGSFSVTEAGNGWYRVQVSGIIGSSASTASAVIYLAEGTSTFIMDGDGSSGIFVWGAQVSQHTTLPVDNPYLKTEGSAVYAARLDHDPTWFMSAAQEQNLLQYSEMINDSYWSALRATISANATTAPDGTLTAEEITEDGTSSASHLVRDASASVNVTEGSQYTFSFYVKRGTGSRNVRLTFRSTNSAFAASAVDFNFDTGAATNTSCDDVAVEDAGNGWFRLSAVETATATALASVQLNMLDGTSTSYDGDSSSSLFIWGAQFEVGSTASTYHRTEGQPYYGPGATPKGLLIEEQRANAVPYSEDFSASGLNPGISPANSVTITSNAALAPDGTNTATKLVAASATGNTGHLIFKIVSVDNDTDAVGSVFVKSAGQRWAYLQLANTGYVSTKNTYADLENGVLGASSDSSATIEDYGNGWYRISLKNTTDSDGGADVIGIGIAEDDGDPIFTGDDTNGIFVWGLQQENGVTFPTSYIKTTGSSATRNADVAVMGPTTGGTELVTNGTFDTDSDWTKGDGWSISGGVASVDGSQSANSNVRQSITTVVGRRYRASVDVTALSHNVRLQAYMGVGDPFTDTSSTGTITLDFTSEQATDNLNIWVTGNVNATATIDNVSVRELYPFEQYNPAEGTVVCESERIGNASFDYIWELGTDSAGENMALLSLDANNIYFGHQADSSGGLTFNAIGAVIGETNITAYAYQQDNYHISSATEGALEDSFTDTSINVADADRLGLGIRPRDEGGPGNCLIKRLTYYPYRLNDDVCDSKVTS